MRILIMGLPGAGKTTLAEVLREELWREGRTVTWLNADAVREKYNDWDFSYNGRIRQSVRMFELSKEATTDYVIADFVAPLEAQRKFFEADWTIWVDTIDASKYEDTNKMFDKPEIYDFRITEQWAEKWAPYIANHIVNNIRRPKWDGKKETVQMLGRWQPWHAGHRKLFERALAKTGQVAIMVRDCQGWNDSNPFNFFEVVDRIKRDLEPLYQGQFSISLVPNIVNITYGRDVGYKIEQEVFDDETHSISATKIRKEMGLE
jgi:phosphopantetheine adenylyltransferase